MYLTRVWHVLLLVLCPHMTGLQAVVRDTYPFINSPSS